MIAALLPAIAFALLVPLPLSAELLPHHADPPPPTPPAWHHYELFNFHIDDDAFPVELAYVGPLPPDMDARAVEEAIDRAAHAWNEIPCSFAAFTSLGVVNHADALDDDVIPISLVDSFESDPPSIARTQFLEFPPPAGTSIGLNRDDYRWVDQPRWDAVDPSTGLPQVAMDAVLAHELGHVLGLDHTLEHQAATMAARYLPDGSQIALSADDKLGACSLYPQGGDECSADGDCPPGAPCVDGPQGALCDIYLAPAGAYCAVDLLHCPQNCQIINDLTGTGYCTRPCDDDTPCPEDMRCGDDQQCLLGTGASAPQPSGCRAVTSRPPPGPLVLAALALLLIASRRTPTTRQNFAQTHLAGIHQKTP